MSPGSAPHDPNGHRVPGVVSPWRRRGWWAGIGAALLLHLLVLGWADRQLGAPPDEAVPAKLDAVFTRTLTPQAPAPGALPPAPPPAPRPPARAAAPVDPAASAARPVDTAASATQAAASAPPLAAADPPATAASSAATPATAGAASAAAGTADAPRQAAADPASAVPGDGSEGPAAGPDTASASGAAAPPLPAARPAGFEWPASTRIRYLLTGWFRGEVHGRASVEWLREGTRYQVHLEVALGPAFAPLMTRRMSSDGDITPRGLRPRRYDEVTTQILGSPRRRQMRFDEDVLTLADGQPRIRPPDVQDTASQFVQLVWRFTVEPRLLHPGASVSFPLALPRRVDAWTYDVVARETLPTPIGPVDTWHVKPRRPADQGDLTAEMWFAPTLQTLPARIRIHQDAQTWIQLDLEALPEQAAR